MPRLNKYLLILASSLGVAFVVHAGDTNDAQDASERFVKNVSMSSLFEIEAAEVALDRSKTPEVRQIAEKMIRDHKASSDKLKALLVQEKLRFRVSMTLDDEHADKIRALKEEKAADFDDKYLEMQEDGHEKTIAEFERFLQAKDTHPALRAYAEKTLPTIKEHHRQIDKAEDKPKGQSFNNPQARRTQIAIESRFVSVAA